MTVFFLNEAEKASGTWLKLLDHIRTRLASLRAQNEMQMEEKDRIALIAKIAVYKELERLHEPPTEGRYDDTAPRG